LRADRRDLGALVADASGVGFVLPSLLNDPRRPLKNHLCIDRTVNPIAHRPWFHVGAG
jgi:hypothetical protein